VSDIGVDAAKTGALISERVVETVATFFEEHPVPLVVDPVIVASTGRRLLDDEGVDALKARLFPLATVITPNLREAELLAGRPASPGELSELLVAQGACAVLITGGHEPLRDTVVDHLYDGREHHEISVARSHASATHGSGCTHSAVLAAELAKGNALVDAARTAAVRTAAAIAAGFADIGRGTGPVDILHTSES